MAGAIAVLIRNTLKSEFRRIDPASARIVLFDAAPRVLGTFSEKLSAAATKRLESLGVEVRLGHAVDQIDADGVIVEGERICSKTVIWTAGVTPSAAGKWLKAPTDRAGRVRIQNDLSVAGHPEIFVIGDTASLDQDGRPLPGVAQVAIQQGRYAGKLIHRAIAGQQPPPPFRYFDKGSMAVVGKGFAVVQSGKFHLYGFMSSQQRPSASESQQLIDEIARSQGFRGSSRMIMLLKLLLEHREGPPLSLKDLADRLYSSPGDKRSAEDYSASVRMNMHRLRHALENYYASDGKKSAFTMTLPATRGGYQLEVAPNITGSQNNILI